MGAHRLGAEVVIRPAGKANMPFGLELGAGPAERPPAARGGDREGGAHMCAPGLGVPSRASCPLIINSSWNSNYYCYN